MLIVIINIIIIFLINKLIKNWFLTRKVLAEKTKLNDLDLKKKRRGDFRLSYYLNFI